ncbi:MAG: helix-turn-helix transcriptional regulator [Chloroflexi bacterium]|nr:helix-turn-helix transcriptional regulator [Chloroflexota bacterium]
MTKSDTNDFGRLLKQRRLIIAITLYELGQAAGVSPSHLGRIERGERYPSAHILKKLAGPLAIDEPELMSMAGYLSPQSNEGAMNVSWQRLDPYVAGLLSQEPVEVQRAAVAIISVLKGMARGLLPDSNKNAEVKNETRS